MNGRISPSGAFVQKGVATLVSGTVSVSGLVIDPDSVVMLTWNTPTGSPGTLRGDTGAASITITASSGNGTVDWAVL